MIEPFSLVKCSKDRNRSKFSEPKFDRKSEEKIWGCKNKAHSLLSIAVDLTIIREIVLSS